MKIVPLLFFCFLMTAPASAKPSPEIQARLDDWVKGQLGGIAMAWVDADGETFFQAGKFDADDARAITPDTPFEIGSITKVFTALLLAESERLGKVSRNDPAAKYLLPKDDPAQPELAKITLLSLVTHISGLPRLPANLGPNPDALADPYSTYDRDALIAALRMHGPSATVGITVTYSNFGAAVLGEALANAWGTTYENALREHVLTPLGLKTTTLGMAGLPPLADLAPGHANGKRVPNWTFLACAPMGAIRSSSRDLAVFLRACLNGQSGPLLAALTATMQPQHAVPETGGQIGLGWFLSGEKDHVVYWHNGATAGSHAFIAFSPGSAAGVVLLANVQKGMEELGFALLGVQPERHAPRIAANSATKEIILPEETLRDYVGDYPLSSQFVLTITESNGGLFAQATGQGENRIFPSAKDEFFFKAVDARLTFSRDSTGKVTSLVLHQNGRDLSARKRD